MSQSIQSHTIFNLLVGSDTLPVPVLLKYSQNNPFEVQAQFGGIANGGVEWVFARDLMRDGLEKPSGDGDVNLSPTEINGDKYLTIKLTSPYGKAVMEVPSSEIEAFLALTADAVPYGEEALFGDFESAINDLLS